LNHEASRHGVFLSDFLCVSVTQWFALDCLFSFLYRTNTSKFRHCEEGALPDEAISNIVSEIASGEYALAMTGYTVEKFSYQYQWLKFPLGDENGLQRRETLESAPCFHIGFPKRQDWSASSPVFFFDAISFAEPRQYKP
jgi:hypothetical protein